MDCSLPGFPVYHQLLEFAQMCPLSRWCHPTISSSVVPFFCFPSCPASESFLMSPFFFIRWPKYWSFSFSISPSMNIQGWFPLGLTGLISLQSKGLSRVFSNITVQKHQFFGTQLSLWSNSNIHTWLLGWLIHTYTQSLCSFRPTASDQEMVVGLNGVICQPLPLPSQLCFLTSHLLLSFSFFPPFLPLSLPYFFYLSPFLSSFSLLSLSFFFICVSLLSFSSHFLILYGKVMWLLQNSD